MVFYWSYSTHTSQEMDTTGHTIVRIKRIEGQKKIGERRKDQDKGELSKTEVLSTIQQTEETHI